MKRFKYIFEYIVLFLLNGIMLWFFWSYLHLLIAAAMILFLLYAVISVHVAARYLSLSVQVPGEGMPKDTTIYVRIRLQNSSVLPLVSCRLRLRTGNVFTGEKVENDLVLPVKPRGVAEVDYPLRSAYVGNVEVSAEELVLEDLLHFHAVTKKVAVTKNIYIVPRGTAEENYDLNMFERGMEEVEESTLKGSDFSDVSQIREYVPGDAIKNIHWKLSAKKDEWMVKERQQMSSRKLRIVLSLERSSPARIDAAVERLYSLGNFMIASRIPVTLVWWSGRYREIRQEKAESADEWLRVIMQLFVTGAEDGFIESRFRSLYPGQGYVLVSEEGVEAREG